MATLTDKQKEQVALMERIEKFISVDDADKAAAGMDDAQMVDFLKAYYLSENLVYDDEINKRTEEALMQVEKELEGGVKAPYPQALVEGVIALAKLGIMDEMVDMVNEQNKPLQAELKKHKITDFAAAMHFQMAMGKTMQNYMMKLAQEMQNECKSRGLDDKAFMRQAIPILSTDMSMIFEIDSFCGLKNFEKVKDSVVTETQVEQFSRETVDLTKLLLEGKVHEAALVVFPSLMNQYLFLKFGIDSYQVMAKVMAMLKGERKAEDLPLFRQLLKEIWYVENGRALIFSIFQQQMEMMEMMAKGGMDPRQMGGDPALMEALAKGNGELSPEMMQRLQQQAQGQGFDPSMLDPAMLQAMGGGGQVQFDPAMMQGIDPAMLQGLDPAMLQAMGAGGQMPPFDPSMMFGMDPSQMDPRTLEAMNMGIQMGNQMREQFSPDQLKQLQEALNSGDLAKIESMIPPEVKAQIDRMKAEELSQGAPKEDKKEAKKGGKEGDDEKI